MSLPRAEIDKQKKSPSRLPLLARASVDMEDVRPAAGKPHPPIQAECSAGVKLKPRPVGADRGPQVRV